MYVRFGGALLLVVLISLCGVALEKHNLDLRRRVSHQSYQQQVLQDQLDAARFQVRRYSAPAETAQRIDASQWARRRSTLPKGNVSPSATDDDRSEILQARRPQYEVH